MTCDQFKKILGLMGFHKRARKSGSSHEDWVRDDERGFFKVTVDCPKAPFSPDLIKSMAKQAGVDKFVIYDVHRNGRSSKFLTAKQNKEEASQKKRIYSGFFQFQTRKESDD